LLRQGWQYDCGSDLMRQSVKFDPWALEVYHGFNRHGYGTSREKSIKHFAILTMKLRDRELPLFIFFQDLLIDDSQSRE
jgi:hypothetical protein